MLFKYKAKNQEGKIKEGIVEAGSQLELARVLREQDFYIIDVEAQGEVGEKGGEVPIIKKLTKFEVGILLEKIKGVPLDEKMMFSRNLAVMIASGIALTRGLEVLYKQAQSPTLKKTIQFINQDVQKGVNFSDAIKKHPKVFGLLYSSMVKVGESAGNLDETLNLLSDQLEKEHELRRKVRGALMYPSVIITALIGIGILMMMTVIPQLKNIFTDLGVELPLTTRLVLGLSDFLSAYWWLFLTGLPFIILGIKKFLDTKGGKKVLSWFLLHMPLFKKLTLKINNAKFARTLSSLISGGVPIIEGLAITQDTLGNTYFQNSISSAAKGLKKGGKLHEALSAYNRLYTPLVLEMIEVGEEAGKLSELLQKVAEFYEEEVSDTTSNMSSIIEPILMIIIGGIVGLFAVSVMQPIYGMLGNV